VSEISDPRTVASLRAYVKLMRASHAVQARLEPRLEFAGLTPLQFAVMEAILHRGPLTHRDLAARIPTSAGNLTEVIHRLAQRELVKRERAPTDRRIRLVGLTETGKTLVTRLFPVHAFDIVEAMKGLSRRELEHLETLLRKLGKAAAVPVEPEAAAK
jgi:MarR family 2-MHQ and catechol resistance regulon transcriptional repressor